MRTEHDRVAERVALILGGTYDPTACPQIAGPRGYAEVTATVSQLPRALKRLARCHGPAYIVLPSREIPAASARLQNLDIGLMDCAGAVARLSTRRPPE
jgi:hypothetical protein